MKEQVPFAYLLQIDPKRYTKYGEYTYVPNPVRLEHFRQRVDVENRASVENFVALRTPLVMAEYYLGSTLFKKLADVSVQFTHDSSLHSINHAMQTVGHCITSPAKLVEVMCEQLKVVSRYFRWYDVSDGIQFIPIHPSWSASGQTPGIYFNGELPLSKQLKPLSDLAQDSFNVVFFTNYIAPAMISSEPIYYFLNGVVHEVSHKNPENPTRFKCPPVWKGKLELCSMDAQRELMRLYKECSYLTKDRFDNWALRQNPRDGVGRFMLEADDVKLSARDLREKRQMLQGHVESLNSLMSKVPNLPPFLQNPEQHVGKRDVAEILKEKLMAVIDGKECFADNFQKVKKSKNVDDMMVSRITSRLNYLKEGDVILALISVLSRAQRGIGRHVAPPPHLKTAYGRALRIFYDDQDD